MSAESKGILRLEIGHIDKIAIAPKHVSEAIQYRTFDRTLWI